MGCSNPCEELAEITCQEGGESSPECKAVREKASKASADDKRACETALGLVESLEKQ